MEVDTIAGLGKHEGSAIAGAFRPSASDGRLPSITGALASLKNYKPTKGPAWERFSDAGFQSHVPRWTKEARQAHDWLVEYQKRNLTK